MAAKTKPLPEAYYKTLEELQAADFALIELQLYLDTHPGDANASAQYAELSDKRAALAEAYEAKYGPLQHYGRSRTADPAVWCASPWPWEI